jgi:hypothetical protein
VVASPRKSSSSGQGGYSARESHPAPRAHKLLVVSPADQDVRAQTQSMRQRAAKERERADYCHARAERHEIRAGTAAESQRPTYRRLAGVYRGAQSRHLMAAEPHELLAARLEHRRDGATNGTRSVLMTAVADTLRSTSALAALGGPARGVEMVVASDATARACHDLELVIAEGPVTDAAKGAPVAAAEQDLLDRWPRYGPAIAELGIRAVSAAPLGLAGVRLGTLTALGETAEATEGAAAANGLMAEALTRILLGSSDLAGPDQDLAAALQLAEADTQAVVHQAIGMISVQCCCGIQDASDLLAARAFADGHSLVQIARQVVLGQQLFPVA